MTDPLDRFLAGFDGDRAQGVTLALRALARRRARDWLAEAELCWEVHRDGHWSKATGADGRAYPSEEAYWEDVLQVDSWRSVTRRLQIGEVLEHAGDPDRVKLRDSLWGIGIAKAAILAPLFDQLARDDRLLIEWPFWMSVAMELRADALQRRVSDALGHKARGMGEPGHRFRTAIINAMPDLDTRQLAEEFFRVGARVVEGANPVRVQVAAMQECLAEWSARAPR